MSVCLSVCLSVFNSFSGFGVEVHYARCAPTCQQGHFFSFLCVAAAFVLASPRWHQLKACYARCAHRMALLAGLAALAAPTGKKSTKAAYAR
jgi:hypothetical protein